MLSSCLADPARRCVSEDTARPGCLSAALHTVQGIQTPAPPGQYTAAGYTFEPVLAQLTTYGKS